MTNQHPVEKLIARATARVNEYFDDIENVEDIVDNWVAALKMRGTCAEFIKCIVWTGQLNPGIAHNPSDNPNMRFDQLTEQNKLFIRNHFMAAYLDMEPELTGLALAFRHQDWFLDDLQRFLEDRNQEPTVTTTTP